MAAHSCTSFGLLNRNGPFGQGGPFPLSPPLTALFLPFGRLIQAGPTSFLRPRSFHLLPSFPLKSLFTSHSHFVFFGKLTDLAFIRMARPVDGVFPFLSFSPWCPISLLFSLSFVLPATTPYLASIEFTSKPSRLPVDPHRSFWRIRRKLLPPSYASLRRLESFRVQPIIKGVIPPFSFPVPLS